MMTENITSDSSIRRPAEMKDDDSPLTDSHQNQNQHETSTCNHVDGDMLKRTKDGDKSTMYNATSSTENNMFLEANNTSLWINEADETKIDVDRIEFNHDDISNRLNNIFRSPPPPAPSTLPITSPTTSAVKESTLQATFAEQTAVEMKEIMDWYHYKDSSVATPSAAATTPRTSSADGDDGDSNNNNTHMYGSELASSVLSPHSHFISRNSLVDDEEVDEFDEWHSHTNGVETVQSNGKSYYINRSDNNQGDNDADSVSSVGYTDLALIDSPNQTPSTHAAATPTQPIIQLPADVKGNLEARTQQREVDRLCNITQEMEDIAKSLPQHDGSDDSSLDLSISDILSIPFNLSPFKSPRNRTPDKEQVTATNVSSDGVSLATPVSRSRLTNREEIARASARSRWFKNFKLFVLQKKANAIEAKRKQSKLKMVIAKTKSNIGTYLQIASQHSLATVLFLGKLYAWGFIHSFALSCLLIEIILTQFGFEIVLVGIFCVARKHV